MKIKKLISGEIDGTAKIVLSGPSNSKCFLFHFLMYIMNWFAYDHIARTVFLVHIIVFQPFEVKFS